MGRVEVILLDTHVVLWLAFDPSQLSRKGRTAIEHAREAERGIAVADITLWELATLAHKGRLHLDVSLESFLTDVESRFTVLPLNGRVCTRALTLPPQYPRDPADRIIGATALVEGVPLLTADREIQRSKAVQTIW